MTLQRGICAECGEPLTMATSIGYHTHCAEVLYKRLGDELTDKYPFAIMIAGDLEEYYTTEAEADERLIHLRHAQIIRTKR